LLDRRFQDIWCTAHFIPLRCTILSPSNTYAVRVNDVLPGAEAPSRTPRSLGEQPPTVTRKSPAPAAVFQPDALRHARDYALHEGSQGVVQTIVVSKQHIDTCSIRPNQHDFPSLLTDRQDNTPVLEQHNRLDSGFVGQQAMFRTVNDAERNRGIRNLG